jgi:nickel-type superoxide dismutase maturation protease
LLVGAAVWLGRHLDRAEVVGISMNPALQAGDRLLVWRTRSLGPGDIVAASDPREPCRTIVKRARWVGDDGVFLVGDNAAASTDSRTFGPVPWGSVQGKAVYRYAPPARTGRLSRALQARAEPDNPALSEG